MRVRIAAISAIVSLGILSSCNKDDSALSERGGVRITSMTPASVSPGQENVKGRIVGENLTGVVAVNLGPGIQLVKTKSEAASELVVRFTVSPTAEPGPRTIELMTIGGRATNSTALTVVENRPPTAVFTASPLTAPKNSAIVFDASGSTDADGSIAAFEWEYGDGQKGSGQRVEHVFVSPGNFKVTLTVIDDKNGKASTERTVKIENVLPPIARFQVSPNKGDINTNFRFDGSASMDRDGRITRYFWQFGDGGSAEGRIVHYRFSKQNTYLVRLTATDNQDLQDTVEKSINVTGRPPVAAFTITPDTGTASTVFTFDASSSYDADGPIAQYSWQIGSTAKTGQVVQHTFGTAGRVSILLTVSDSSGQRDSAQKSLTVGGGDPPPTSRHCPPPAFMQGAQCCYDRCCSQDATEKGSIGWCSGRIMCTAGSQGYRPPLPGFEHYPGLDCSEFPD